MVERRVAGTRTSAVDAERIVDDVSLRLTAAGLTPADAVVLLRLDSGALERKVLRSGTRSQCRFTSSGVTWSNLRALVSRHRPS